MCANTFVASTKQTLDKLSNLFGYVLTHEFYLAFTNYGEQPTTSLTT